jgi:hypothetical protein
MLRRFWEWLARLWRPPPPPEPDPAVIELLEMARARLTDWAMNKLRNDIIAGLQDDAGLPRTPYSDHQRPPR